MIECREITYRYEAQSADGRPVLDGVSLTIDDGSFVVLAGANGSGKTTLVRHCNGLYTPDAGSVLINGVSVAAAPVAARTAVAMTFQEPRDGFVAATVGADVAFGPENLGLDRATIDQRVEDALAAVGLTGYEGTHIEHLSGGERMRVAIAGALAMQPDHLLLDEPLVGLDAPAEQSVLDRLSALSADGMSIVVVTHELRDLVELADRIVVLADGAIALDGQPAAVCDRLPEYGVSSPC
ncbi:energy-coupling factor ABC transporter ATP-binding protein [Halocatena halophila]|uniref:energy-coupling factor ABC transporter ATP-binding protein n=1 Tax=Halocatena halophila TaxID=2814576 RepID=UPI002ED3D7D4